MAETRLQTYLRALQKNENLSIKSSNSLPTDYLEAIYVNRLDEYITTRYHINLSIVDISTDRLASGEVQATPNKKDEQFSVSKQDLLKHNYFTFASTGSSPSNIKYKGFDDILPRLFYINSFNYQEVAGPNMNTSRSNNAVFEANMKIIEPNGFSFNKVIQDIASRLGYANRNATNIIYRIDIWFSGYKEDGTYVDKIEFDFPFIPDSPEKGSVFTHFMAVTSVKASLSSPSSELELTMVPASMRATFLRDRYLKLTYAQSINLGALAVRTATFKTYMTALENHLNEKIGKIKIRLTETSPEIEYQQFKYKIISDTTINDSRMIFNEIDIDTVEKFFTTFEGSTIVNVIEAIIRKTIAYQLGIQADPKILYTIRVVSDYGDTSNSAFPDLLNVTHTFFVEQFIDHRIVAKPTEAANQDARTKLETSLIDTQALRRVYHYNFFGLNTEIIDFTIDINNFYFVEIAQMTALRRAGESSSAPTKARPKPSGTASPSLANTERPNIDIVPSRDLTLPGDTLNDIMSGEEEAEIRFQSIVQTNHTMLKSLSVRGDPRWMWNILTRDFNDMDVIPAKANKGNVIIVNVISPKPREYMSTSMSPLYNSENVQHNFTYAYQLSGITHKFEEGMFTQSFDGSIIQTDFAATNMEAIEKNLQQQREQKAVEPASAPTGSATTASANKPLASSLNKITTNISDGTAAKEALELVSSNSFSGITSNVLKRIRKAGSNIVKRITSSETP